MHFLPLLVNFPIVVIIALLRAISDTTIVAILPREVEPFSDSLDAFN